MIQIRNRNRIIISDVHYEKLFLLSAYIINNNLPEN